MLDKTKIRQLNIDDVFKLAEIIDSVSETVQGQLVTAIKSDDSDMPFMRFFLKLFLVAKPQIKEFLADICGLTVEEFSKQPLSILGEIYDAQGDVKSFLSRLYGALAGKWGGVPKKKS